MIDLKVRGNEALLIIEGEPVKRVPVNRSAMYIMDVEATLELIKTAYERGKEDANAG